ncbi:MAG UNVERIFIED_CONTAM: hypothetical protein LVR18_48370, partial [Planctomycetaceae bacterium]
TIAHVTSSCRGAGTRNRRRRPATCWPPCSWLVRQPASPGNGPPVTPADAADLPSIAKGKSSVTATHAVFNTPDLCRHRPLPEPLRRRTPAHYGCTIHPPQSPPPLSAGGIKPTRHSSPQLLNSLITANQLLTNR